MMTIKKVIIVLSVILIVIMAALLLHTKEKNSVSCSAESGFYEEAFDLILRGPGKIYYTLDSSDPTMNSTVYSEPIHIYDRSSEENVYAAVEDVSPELREDFLGKYVFDTMFSIPDKSVDKATVVKFFSVDEEGNCSDVITKVYFVGYKEKSGYDNIPILSIVTNPDNLFNYENGIYVCGREYEEYIADTSEEEFDYKSSQANYFARGLESERKSHITIFNSERKIIADGDFGLRVSGSKSRVQPQKSLNLFERDEYKDSNLNARKMGFDYDATSLNLFAGGNESGLMLTDVLVNRALEGTNLSTRDYILCEMFLDGEYWGTYYLTERFERQYFQNNYGINSDEIIHIKNDEVESGNPEDIKFYNDLIDFVTNNDMSDSKCFEAFCNMVDIDNCIDYYATQIYIDNLDWPQNNFALWRTRNITDHDKADGKWRFLIFDLNMAMYHVNAAEDTFERLINEDIFFASLAKNDIFKSKLFDRLYTLANNEFNPDDACRLIDSISDSMIPAMENCYIRFFDETDFSVFKERVENEKRFVKNRYNYIIENYGKE